MTMCMLIGVYRSQHKPSKKIFSLKPTVSHMITVDALIPAPAACITANDRRPAC